MEVVSGHNVFDGLTGANKTRALTKDLIGGYPAIGDFNRDGHPDIVLVSSRNGDQKVSILDYFNNRFLMPPTAAKDGWGGRRRWPTSMAMVSRSSRRPVARSITSTAPTACRARCPKVSGARRRCAVAVGDRRRVLWLDGIVGV